MIMQLDASTSTLIVVKAPERNPEAFRDPIVQVNLTSAFQSLIGPQTWQSAGKGHE
jgi:hypothetical protein